MATTQESLATIKSRCDANASDLAALASQQPSTTPTDPMMAQMQTRIANAVAAASAGNSACASSVVVLQNS